MMNENQTLNEPTIP